VIPPETLADADPGALVIGEAWIDGRFEQTILVACSDDVGRRASNCPGTPTELLFPTGSYVMTAATRTNFEEMARALRNLGPRASVSVTIAGGVDCQQPVRARTFDCFSETWSDMPALRALQPGATVGPPFSPTWRSRAYRNLGSATPSPNEDSRVKNSRLAYCRAAFVGQILAGNEERDPSLEIRIGGFDSVHHDPRGELDQPRARRIDLLIRVTREPYSQSLEPCPVDDDVDALVCLESCQQRLAARGVPAELSFERAAVGFDFGDGFACSSRDDGHGCDESFQTLGLELGLNSQRAAEERCTWQPRPERTIDVTE